MSIRWLQPGVIWSYNIEFRSIFIRLPEIVKQHLFLNSLQAPIWQSSRFKMKLQEKFQYHFTGTCRVVTLEIVNVKISIELAGQSLWSSENPCSDIIFSNLFLVSLIFPWMNFLFLFSFLRNGKLCLANLNTRQFI